MFGDSFFTVAGTMRYGGYTWRFSSPCLGILFSPKILTPPHGKCGKCFRPHVWGFFFHWQNYEYQKSNRDCFRPHVWGFFFHSTEPISNAQTVGVKFSSPCLGILFSLMLVVSHLIISLIKVFVPMFGDSFFTKIEKRRPKRVHEVFVPMFGDSFFTR